MSAFLAILGIVKSVITNPMPNAVKDNPKAALTAFLTACIALAASYGYEVPPVWTEWLTTGVGALAVVYALGGKKEG